jgi:hypothetical protein
VRNDILNGVIKSIVFGVAVTWIAVFEGYDAAPDRRGRLGRHHPHGGDVLACHPGARFRAHRPDVHRR